MVLATATKIAGKALVKKLVDTPYVAAMKKLAQIQHTLTRQEKLKKLIDIKNTTRLNRGRRKVFTMDDPVWVGDVSKGKTKQLIPRKDTDPKITIYEGKGYSGTDLPATNYTVPFEKTEKGRRAFIDSKLDELEKGIVGHYKRNKSKLGFKTAAEAENWAKQRLLFTPLSTMQRWAQMQLGPVAKREFGHSILPSGFKGTGERSGYGITGMSEIITDKFGRRTPIGAGPKYKIFQVRRQERDLENFLRQPTGKKGEINADIIATDDIVRIGRFPSLSRKRILTFRKEKELQPKITDPRSLKENIFGLKRSEALAYSKTDPQLAGIFSMGKGEGPLGTKLQDMIYKYADPSKFSSEYAKSQAMLHRLHDRLTEYNPGIPPKAVSFVQRNNMHKEAEVRLRKLDDMIKRKLGDKNRIKEWKKEMKEIGEDMELLGLQSDVNGVVYGKWYAKAGDPTWKQMLPFFRSLKKEFPLKRLQMKGPTGKTEKYKYKGFDEGGVIDHFQAGGLVGLGSKILAKLAKKLSEKELKMLMGSLWKGVDPKKSGRYRTWDKQRWGPGYKWPYKKSRIRGPGIKKSHYASLSDEAKERLRERYAKRLAEYIARKKGK
jgi:hypothetical protein